MLGKIKAIWDSHGFEIVLGMCVAFILLFALYYKIVGKKGTYSRGRYFVNSTTMPRSRPSVARQPPRESKGEAECRRVMQQLFDKPFPSQRPDFLRNPVTGGHFNLELDCYNAELKLAVEYNGEQHYYPNHVFHRTPQDFQKLRERDLLKSIKCDEAGVRLIIVPFVYNYTCPDEMRECIMDRLTITHGIDLESC